MTPRTRRVAALALAGAAAAAITVPTLLTASSHREAPRITQDPTADNTDVYAFTSPDAPDTATLIANYIPFEEPSGGPNFHAFSDQVRYGVHVDNTGDGEADVSYLFRFKTQVRNPDTFLYATGPVRVDAGAYTNLNVVQTYTVQRVTRGTGGRRVVRTLGRGLLTPPNNVGPKTTPDYAALVAPAIHTLRDGTRVFAGQRDDPFFVDLGSVFDLVNIDAPGRPGIGIGNQGGGGDGVTGFNVHSIAIQVPKRLLTQTGRTPADASDPRSVVGVYATAERPVLTFREGRGQVGWKQVSRLGQPLINEVVIPLGRKDRWNAGDPADDRQFASHYRAPELARALNALFPGVVNAPEQDRDDLVSVLLTGLPPGNPFGLVTQVGTGRPAKADLLRLNLAVPPTPPAQQDRMGVLAGQADGFPNGRRLIDDVVDIELQAIAGVLVRPAGQTPALGDGVDDNDLPFLSAFPYVPDPTSGFGKRHPRPSAP
jgi:hypothetical protein